MSMHAIEMNRWTNIRWYSQGISIRNSLCETFIIKSAGDISCVFVDWLMMVVIRFGSCSNLNVWQKSLHIALTANKHVRFVWNVGPNQNLDWHLGIDHWARSMWCSLTATILHTYFARTWLGVSNATGSSVILPIKSIAKVATQCRKMNTFAHIH